MTMSDDPQSVLERLDVRAIESEMVDSWMPIPT
jgi:hypothetical protein